MLCRNLEKWVPRFAYGFSLTLQQAQLDAKDRV
jgi:hypothetical protein